MQRQYVVHSIRNDSKPGEGAPASRDVSGAVSGMVHQAARSGSCGTRADDARSISRDRKFSARCAAMRREEIYRLRNRRDVSRGSETAPFFVGEAVCFPMGRQRRPYSSVPSLGGELDENFSSGFTKFPGNGRTRSKMRAAKGFAVVYPTANISR